MTNEEKRQRRRDRYRERYANDPEFRAHVLAKGKEWSNNNRDKRAARKRRWRERNIEKALAQERAFSEQRRQDPAYREAARRRTEEWRKRHPQHNRSIVLRRYGIDEDEYRAMLAAQDGVCACCGGEERTIGRNSKPKRLAVDHDHETGAIRGLLCGHCNKGIGHFSDAPELLRRAAQYIESNTRKEEVA